MPHFHFETNIGIDYGQKWIVDFIKQGEEHYKNIILKIEEIFLRYF